MDGICIDNCLKSRYHKPIFKGNERRTRTKKEEEEEKEQDNDDDDHDEYSVHEN